MKKIGLFFASIVLVPLILLLFALASLNKIITEEFLVSQIEKSLNVRAEIKDINISIFSAISSITVDGVKLSHRDKYADNATPLAERKPLDSANISMENLDFQINFLSLLKGEIQLKKLILKNPKINLTLNENGSNNLSPMFLPPKLVEGKPNESLNKTDSEEEKKDSEEEDNRPFSIKSFPLSANLQEIGIQSGTINLVVKKTQQKLEIESLNLIINSIDIVPEDLKNHNSIQLDLNLVLKILSHPSNEEKAKLSLKSFAKISPFLPDTGTVNPQVNYNIVLKKDSYLNGMAVFDMLTNSIPVLKNAGIEPKGISEKASLTKDVSAEIQYFSGNIKTLGDISIPTNNYELELSKGSSITITNNQHKFNAAIKLSKQESDKSLSGVLKMKAEKPELVPIIDTVLSKVTKDDRLYIPFESSGDLGNPQVTVGIELPSILDMTKDLIKNKIGDELQKELDKKIPGGGNLLKKFL